MHPLLQAQLRSPLFSDSPVMAATAPAAEEPPAASQPPLSYQTWVLKVSIHCQGCRKKVKKVLQSIEGVYTISIESQLQKVTVIGNIDAQTLITKLIKIGRPAELWPENKPPNGKEKKAGKSSGNENDSESRDNSEDEDEETNNSADPQVKIGGGTGGAATVRFMGLDTTITDNKPPANVAVAVAGQGGGKKKKKKRKKKSGGGGGPAPNPAPAATGLETPKMGPAQGIDSVNLGPPSQNLQHYSPNLGNHKAYVVTYNAAHSTVTSAHTLYAPSSPYTYADHTAPEAWPVRSASLDSFEILSDENPNACSIM